MLDSRDIGGLQGAPIHGPDDEKIGNVAQVFVDPATESPNWVTLKTGFLGRTEIFAPLANATWDGEVLRIPIDKDALLAAPRLDADEGLSPHNEEALNRHFGLSEVDTDGGTARPAEDYPEHPELLEQAAARQREDEATAADHPTEAAGVPAEYAPVQTVPETGQQHTTNEATRNDQGLAEQPHGDDQSDAGRTTGPRHAKGSTTL